MLEPNIARNQGEEGNHWMADMLRQYLLPIEESQPPVPAPVPVAPVANGAPVSRCHQKHKKKLFMFSFLFVVGGGIALIFLLRKYCQASYTPGFINTTDVNMTLGELRGEDAQLDQVGLLSTLRDVQALKPAVDVAFCHWLLHCFGSVFSSSVNLRGEGQIAFEKALNSISLGSVPPGLTTSDGECQVKCDDSHQQWHSILWLFSAKDGRPRSLVPRRRACRPVPRHQVCSPVPRHRVCSPVPRHRVCSQSRAIQRVAQSRAVECVA